MNKQVLLRAVFFSLVPILIVGCHCQGPRSRTCTSMDDCSPEQMCNMGRCVEREDAAVDVGLDRGVRDIGSLDLGIADAACEVRCGTECCQGSQECLDNRCITIGNGCTSNDECRGDTYCATERGQCLPYGYPSNVTHDPSCTRLAAAGTFAPVVQCAFNEAPSGDAFRGHLHVLSTPMVMDLKMTANSRPSIIAVFDDGVDGSSEEPTGVIRILDGATCTQQAELGSLQMTSHSSPVAVGDLDGDGKPEIVAYKAGGGLVAFRYEGARWTVLWRSTLSDGSPYNIAGGGWAGPSIYDLDDDGIPEVLRGGIVFSNDGRVIDNSSLGQNVYSSGTFPVVADVDADGMAEYISGNGIWQWDRSNRRWVREAYFPANALNTNGHVAIADFGAFPSAENWPANTPEIVVVSAGRVRVQTLDGTIVFGPIILPANPGQELAGSSPGGTGGPPTVADFDGDGRPEIASAGATSYTVFDLDCQSTGAIGQCASSRTDGVLWTQRSQDASSNVTGSSIFDFEGDGPAEVVYGDECFLRVYDGRSGDVLFSQARSSCTWYENPVVADVDGDFNTEIVIGDNYNCGDANSGRSCSAFGLGEQNTDPLFAGLRCADSAECLSGNCVAGFCRCQNNDECCLGAGCESAAYVCVDPPLGTPGSGRTCRASRPIGTLGIRVYRDSADRWVRSRTLWNQHAYHVTNVNDDGTIPRTSLAQSNWLDPSLNNFRANVQGAPVPGASPDITAGVTEVRCDQNGDAVIPTRMCNRGTDIVARGVSVGFFAGDPEQGGTRICQAITTLDLAIGQCETIECQWANAPSADQAGIDVWVVADDTSENFECRESNNIVTYQNVRCGSIIL